MTAVEFCGLDILCPMHLVLSDTGHVRHAGPTVKKLRPDLDLTGARFLELFDVKRPRAVTKMADLSALAGTKLHLQLRDPPQTELKGVIVPGPMPGHFTVNLSFGISIVDGVRDYALTSADFAPTDLTVEMLYLVEAKSAAMEASRKLNLRLQGAKIAAEEQAFTDTLTGLKNRRAMDHIMARYEKWGTQFGLMQIDLDWFKAVNDNMGHAAGDHVLQTVAHIMVEETRDNDTVVRIGGDEFVVLLPSAQEMGDLAAIGHRIIERLTQPIPFAGKECRISASIGVALFDPEGADTTAQVLDNADVALYASKNAGRAQLTFYEPELRENVTEPASRSA
ncbi:MAG: GGDEF domain-containing protein [Pseudomonadota bacterium]